MQIKNRDLRPRYLVASEEKRTPATETLAATGLAERGFRNKSFTRTTPNDFLLSPLFAQESVENLFHPTIIASGLIKKTATFRKLQIASSTVPEDWKLQSFYLPLITTYHRSFHNHNQSLQNNLNNKDTLNNIPNH